jgi:hypothetical protein
MVPPAAFMVMLALLSGCQWTHSRKTTIVPPPPPQPGVDIGQVAPDIEGDDLDGQHLRLADYRGRVVVLTFWSKA